MLADILLGTVYTTTAVSVVPNVGLYGSVVPDPIVSAWVLDMTQFVHHGGDRGASLVNGSKTTFFDGQQPGQSIRVLSMRRRSNRAPYLWLPGTGTFWSVTIVLILPPMISVLNLSASDVRVYHCGPLMLSRNAL